MRYRNKSVGLNNKFVYVWVKSKRAKMLGTETTKGSLKTDHKNDE